MASTARAIDESNHDDNAQVIASSALRKVDMRLIPLLFITYMFNFMDKTILSSASVFGLIDDTHLIGQQYSWVSSIFYFGYFFWEVPTNYLIPRLPVAKYLAANTLFWGAVVALTAACVNYGGLLAVRFLLGIAEATITPAFMFITTTWYTRDEIPFRTGIWFSGNSIGGLVASLLAYGSALIYARAHHVPLGAQLFGYFLLATGPGALPLAMSLVQANYRGVTKKMTMTAMMFVAYCAGNIAGPQLFRASEAPTYQTSFKAILICYIISGGLAISLRVYLQLTNKRRDHEEGVQGNASLSGAVGGKVVQDRRRGDNDVSELVRSVDLRPEDYEDVTDWKTVGFRYRL
ncbi:hypothetical protein APSETT445_003678 [Aspergillus pseudonomiae]